jgi:hypothetical protein
MPRNSLELILSNEEKEVAHDEDVDSGSVAIVLTVAVSTAWTAPQLGVRKQPEYSHRLGFSTRWRSRRDLEHDRPGHLVGDRLTTSIEKWIEIVEQPGHPQEKGRHRHLGKSRNQDSGVKEATNE